MKASKVLRGMFWTLPLVVAMAAGSARAFPIEVQSCFDKVRFDAERVNGQFTVTKLEKR